jgi:hypothetical protein
MKNSGWKRKHFTSIRSDRQHFPSDVSPKSQCLEILAFEIHDSKVTCTVKCKIKYLFCKCKRPLGPGTKSLTDIMEKTFRNSTLEWHMTLVNFIKNEMVQGPCAHMGLRDLCWFHRFINSYWVYTEIEILDTKHITPDSTVTEYVQISGQ